MKTALVSGAFTAVIALGMALGWVQYQRTTPLDAPSIAALKAQLLKTPQDDKLKEQIRAEDLRLRTAHQKYLGATRRGTWLLGAGMIVFLASVQTVFWRKKLCALKQPKKPGADFRAMLQGSAAVLVLGALAGGGAWWLAQASGTQLTGQLANSQASAALGTAHPTDVGIQLASAEEIQRNWGRFRGPDGCGVSTQTNIPLTWDVKTGANVIWKVPVPAPGYNSPIIWGERLFFSGGNEKKREVFCLDTKTGATLWQQAVENVPGAPAEPQEISESTGYAAATMATDGQRVYAFFANGDLAAFTLEGKLAWAKSMGVMKNQHGHAASIFTWQGRLIMQLDQGDLEERKSKLYAFDGATGQVVWQSPRPSPSSWASPILIQAAGKAQIICLGIPHVIGYAAADGKELWRVEGLENEVTPSPIYAGGMVFAISPSAKLIAIRPDGHGDVTRTHVAWVAEENIPDVTSPVSNGELVFTISSGGLLTCWDAKTGKKVWDHDFELEFQASPTLVGDRLYLFSGKNAALVVPAGREFKQLARMEMEDKFYASPAIVQNRMYLRGLKQLYCIGAKEAAK